MNIFISYPREKKDKAIIIASELSGVGDTIFIDENSIDYSDEWKVKVKEGLKKSNIFIILYNLDEKSSQDPARFIYTEIKLIEKEIIRKPKKKL
ncbi:toll/interleukin-1 receptor domain-containing protein [uncultured Thiothrix sp.]|uniref:toll/interleukin-1 receptor domain-containing protein n=1 Tax=uncultured Thiothrix sp. TaxID=223185 RepID=UPI0026362B0B|nr:toll/interleukin-1 receptor domain-containing protein [uncultured Thiothrix sp.]